MAGNSFGTLFRVTSFGESHGIALGCIIDGCPPGLELSELDIQKDLDERKPGTSKFVTQRKESDKALILSGVFDGKTTGTPISIIIFNEDHKSKDYLNIADKFRPGHADYTYFLKYGIRDYRGSGRASARETIARVAAGAVAKKWLSQKFNLQFVAYITQIGIHEIKFEDENYINQNPFFIANKTQISEIENYLESIRTQKDSIGAKLKIIARNVPVGLGYPVFNKLDADIASAMMGINAVKGVEIGDGFSVVNQNGSIHGDQLSSNGFLSNHSGGVLGGISTGAEIIINIAFKPTSSISLSRRTIDQQGMEVNISTTGRHDPCVGLRGTAIAKSMLALVLMDHTLLNIAQCHDIEQDKNILFNK